MPGMRDFGNALTTALLSILLTVGALSISLVGFAPEEETSLTATAPMQPLPVTATNTFPPTLTPLVAADTPTITATNTLPSSVTCPQPAGWIAIIVQAGDTLDSLAGRYRIAREIFIANNCLIGNESLIIGKFIYVPAAPTSTVMACSPGAAGWIPAHVVKSGDTFFNIGGRYGYSAAQIKAVNCRISDLIFIGETLWVPNIPTRTPTTTPPPGITFTPAPLQTEPITQTVLPFTGTPIWTQTPIPTTSTVAPSPTAVSTQTASPTAFPTNTP